MSEYCGCCRMSSRDVSRSRKGVLEGGGGAVPALMTLLGVVFLLRDRRPSRPLCLPLVAPGRGGIVTDHWRTTSQSSLGKRRWVQ